MITYEYKCDKTDEEFERQMRISESTPTVLCLCGSNAARHYRTVPHVDTYFGGSYKAEASIAGN